MEFELIMKKALIAIAIITAGVTTYLYQQQSEPQHNVQLPTMNELAFVPADTLLFFGQLQAFPIKNYLTYFNFGQTESQRAALEYDLLETEEPSGIFFANLMQQYSQAVASPELFTQTFGLNDEVKGLFYTVGLLPVIRYEIAKPEALWQMLATAEKESGLVGKKETIQGLEVVKYELVNQDGQSLELVVAVQHGWATITFNSSFNEPADLLQALALEKPKSSLAQTDTLQAITSRHQLDGKSVGFFNHEALINGLTGKENNLFSQMLNRVSQNQLDTEMAQMRSPACQADFATIASNWPRTVFGSEKLVIEADEIVMRTKMVVESQSSVLKSLASIRGFLPDFTQSAEQKMLSLALGVDVAKVSPALTNIWTEFTEAKYSCQPLVDMQQEAKQNNPMMLTMMTSMATGVKGVSASLLDLQLSQQQGEPQFDKLDALVTVSANNPIALFNSVKGFYAPLMEVSLPADGSSIMLGEYLDLPFGLAKSIQLAAKGEHLVLFKGEKAEKLADSLSKQDLTANGFNNFAMDYQALFGAVFTLIEESGEEIPPEFAALKDLNMQLYFDTDFTDQGIEMVSEISSKK